MYSNLKKSFFFLDNNFNSDTKQVLCGRIKAAVMN